MEHKDHRVSILGAERRFEVYMAISQCIEGLKDMVKYGQEEISTRPLNVFAKCME